MGKMKAQGAARNAARRNGKGGGAVERPLRSGLSLAVGAALLAGAALAAPQVALAQSNVCENGQHWTGGLNSSWENQANWALCMANGWIDNAEARRQYLPPGMSQFGFYPIIDAYVGTHAATLDGRRADVSGLTVGRTSGWEGNMLAIRNGGALHATSYVHLGERSQSYGLVMVDGPGSALTARTELRVGYGGVGEIAVENGGHVSSGFVILGNLAGSRGLVTLKGGSTMDTRDLWIGFGARAWARMVVDSGSAVTTSARAYVAASGGTEHNEAVDASVVVSGAGSAWRIGDYLEVGRYVNRTGTMDILDGGRVEVLTGSAGATSVMIGYQSADGTVTVSGVNEAEGLASTFVTGPGWLRIGGNQGRGILNVLAGGVVNSAIASLGEGAGDGTSTGIANIEGAGSLWTTDSLRIGYGGRGTLGIRDGGVVESASAIVGASNVVGTLGEVEVSGEGSRWDVSGLVSVGLSSGTGRVAVSNGGSVSAGSLDISNNGHGSVLVTGAGSALEVTDTLRLSPLWTSSLLQVEDGASLHTGNALVGSGLISGQSAIVNISGQGTRWTAGGIRIGIDYPPNNFTARPIVNLSGGATIEADSITLYRNNGWLVVGGGMDAQGDLQAATAAGTLDVGRIAFTGTSNFDATGRLIFNHTDADYVLASQLTGRGFVDHMAGHTTFTGGSSDYAGSTTVTGGTLLVDGTLAGRVDVRGGTFGGSGTVADVSVADGATLSPGGMEVGTLTVGNLTLSDQSIVRFDLGTADAVAGEDNDLVEVTGNLVLDGQLHIDAAPAFGNGVYRLFNYGGTLTDNGLVFNTIMGGGDYDGADFGIQTAIGGQVNLVVGGIAAPILFWQGGSGIWDAESEHWTDANGTRNDNWGGTFAVFQGEGGTVTVVGEQDVTGLQFAADGYSVVGGEGGALRLVEPETIIRIDPGNTARVSVALTGDSALVQRDAGTLVLSGNNSYTGGTQLFEGVLEAASDAALGATQGNVTFRGGTLRVGDGFATSRGFDIGSEGGRLETSGNVRYNGVLSGSAAFHRIGGGVFDFAGDGSGYTGVFGSGGGRFNLSGVLGGLLDLASNATLSGTGRANDLRIGGRLAPGNSIGTLLADGDVTFLPGSVFEVEVAANGSSDLLQVSGNVDIQGGTVEVLALDPHRAYADGQQYTFLTAAGGLTGTFAGVTDNSAFLDFTLAYTGTSALLTLTRVATFPEVAQTWNQVQSSTGLRDLGSSGDALAVYNTLLMLDAPSARNAFDAASGEIHPGNQQAMAAAGHAFNRTLLRQPDAQGPGLWLAGVYDTGKIDGDGNAVGLDRRVEGIAFGYGAGASTETGGWTLGGAIGTTRTRADMDGRASRARGDAWHAGLYGSWSHGAWEARGALGYMDGDADIARGIAFGGLARNAVATQDMDAFGFSGELAWRMTEGTLAVAPLLTVDAVRANFDATRESGADALDLSLARQRHEQVEVGAGLRLSGALGNGGYELRAVYVQDVGGDRTAERSGLFAGSPTAFTVRGPEADKERVRLGAGVSYPISDGMSLGLRYEGTFAGSGNTQGVMARFDWRF